MYSKISVRRKKKYRTLEVRKAELILCTDSNNYIEILNQYEKFEHYAKENDITVFKGYCNTQKGKLLHYTQIICFGIMIWKDLRNIFQRQKSI